MTNTYRGMTRQQLLEENAKMLMTFLKVKGNRSITDDWQTIAFSTMEDTHDNIVMGKVEAEIERGQFFKVTIKTKDVEFLMFDFIMDLENHLLIFGKMNDDQGNADLFEFLQANYQEPYFLLAERKGDGEIINYEVEEPKPLRLSHQEVMAKNGKSMVRFLKSQGIDINEHWQKCHFQEGNDTFTIERALVMNEDGDGKRQVLDGCMLIIEPDSDISFAPQRFVFTDGNIPIMSANGNVMEDKKLKMFLELITSVPFKLTKKEMVASEEEGTPPALMMENGKAIEGFLRKCGVDINGKWRVSYLQYKDKKIDVTKSIFIEDDGKENGSILLIELDGKVTFPPFRFAHVDGVPVITAFGDEKEDLRLNYFLDGVMGSPFKLINQDRQ